MPQPQADRNLLFGILALQMDFISRDALIEAMHAWVLDKQKPLGEILVGQRALATDERGLLESVVCKHLERHGQNTRESLSTVSTIDLLLPALRELADPDVDASLNHVGRVVHEAGARVDPDATTPRSAGALGQNNRRFQVVRFHARGGLGEVYVARDIELNREVALKQLQDHLADRPENQARFLVEAEVTGALEHKGVVPVYGLGRFDDGRPFYAMRFIGGTSLKEAIREFHGTNGQRTDLDSRPIELRRLLGRFVDVCDTVAYAHSRGVWHRDLKPSNIMLGKYGETIVLDWGLAKAAGRREPTPETDERTVRPMGSQGTPPTLTGALLGTPAFMSPEQAEGQTHDIGAASDVYSLGATLYCLLTGKAPFESTQPEVVLPLVRAGDFPRPRTVLTKLHRGLEAICLKAMALRSQDRYPTAKALGEDIERWLADEPVQAYPEPIRVRAMRWVRRRKQWVAAAGVVLALGSAGLAAHDWRISREEARTSEQLGVTREVLHGQLKFAGENLAYLPNAEKLRKALTEMTRAHYEELSKRFPHDPGVQLGMAQVMRVLGGIGRITGEFRDASKSYATAIEILSSLCIKDSANQIYWVWLVEAHTDRGELHHIYGRADDAARDIQAAIRHTEKLPHLSADYCRGRAAALINLSEILILKNEYLQAAHAADQAVNLLRTLNGKTSSAGSESRDLWYLSMAMGDRGVATASAGSEDGTNKAVNDLLEAETVARSIPDDDDYHGDAQFQIAVIHNHLAQILSTNASRVREARASLDRASQILTSLVSDRPRFVHYREEIAVTLRQEAQLDLDGGDVTEAEKPIRASVGHLRKLIEDLAQKNGSPSPQYHGLLGQSLETAARVARAMGRESDAKAFFAEAEEQLGRAVALDPARAADMALLGRLKSDTPAR